MKERFLPGLGERGFRRRPKEEKVYPRVDVGPLLDQLNTFNLGDRITFYNPKTLQDEPIGYIVPLNGVRDLVIMNSGIMQLRTAATEELNRKYPLHDQAKVGASGPGDTAQFGIDTFLGIKRGAVNEQIITNNARAHKKDFAEALSSVQELIAERHALQSETEGLLKAALPEEPQVAAYAKKNEMLELEMSRTIDALAEEGFGKAVVANNYGKNEVIGYVLPVPQETDIKDETTRKLILMKREGRVLVVDLPEGSSMRKAYADKKTLEFHEPYVFYQSLKEPRDYTLVTSNDVSSDQEVLTTSYASSTKWLEEKRAARRNRLAAETSTAQLLTALTEGKTEPTIEEKARELLGRKFVGVEAVHAVEKYIEDSTGKEIKFIIDPVPPIPYTEADLTVAKEKGELLILRPSAFLNNLQVEEPLTIGGFISLFDKEQPFKWGEETFIHNVDQIQMEWVLISNGVLTDSIGVSPSQQEAAMQKYSDVLKAAKADTIDLRQRTALEFIWDSLAFQFYNGVTLDFEHFERTSSTYSTGRSVNMKMTNGQPQFFDWMLKSPHSKIGVLSTR